MIVSFLMGFLGFLMAVTNNYNITNWRFWTNITFLLAAFLLGLLSF